MLKTSLRIVSSVLGTAILFSSVFINAVSVSAANGSQAVAVADNVSSQSEVQDYNNYLKNVADFEQASSSVQVPLAACTAENADIQYSDDGLLWNDGDGKISFDFFAEKAGLYNLKIIWKPIDPGVDVTFSMMLNKVIPFDEAQNITLAREWKNATDTPRADDQGNEYSQEQVETGDFIETVLIDSAGIVVEPFMFAVTAGKNTVTFSQPKQSVIIKSIELCPPEKTSEYKALAEDYKLNAVDTDIIAIQGENADIKSSNSIIPKSNNSDSGMTPIDPFKTKINYIGSTAWQSPTEKLTWNFSVKEAGYYSVAMRYKQSDLVNGESLRWLKIDGETPFNEAKNISFPYDTKWKYMTFSDADSNPYYIYLDEGDHTLSMEVTMGSQSQFYERLSAVVNTLGDEYVKIIKITSESPDVNRDYELFNQIPNFNDNLTLCRDSLKELAADMKKSSGSNSSQAIAAMENMARVLNNMIKSPYIAQQYVKDYYSNYASVSAWLYDMSKMPLSLDEIQIVPYGKEYEDKSANIFKRFTHWIIRLTSSFTSDYSLNKSDGENKETIRLWIGWGQDQASVLNSMIKDSFTPQTGINVQLEIVSASLINGILSGNFPDVVLNMTRTDPVNLGIRGALTDLTQFADYKEVLERFQPGSEIPYLYNDALYALPDTQAYFLMYYRTDVFEDLGLTVPNTWDEFIYASTIIQRNNMSVFVPYTQIAASTTVNAGIGNLHLFPTLLLQNNLKLYNDTLDATAINSKQAIDVFKYWTNFYTEYGYLKEADFYNRFRVGAMPLGIASHATYLTLCSAAPEIKGRWKIALVPGTVNENGELNRTVSGGGTGCSIVEKSKNKEAAWEFLKWWTSDTVQTRYSNNVESILGTISRTSTSNIKAFQSLAWEKDDLDIFMEEWSNVTEIPEVPGSYYLTRAVDQAYWAVINGESTAKDAIVEWSKVADEEIARKIDEYS